MPRKKFKIAFLSEQLFMEQISHKKFILIIEDILVISNHIQLVLNLSITSCLFSNWIPTDFFLDLLADEPALAPKNVKDSAFEMLSETIELNENESWILNFPIDNFLKRNRHSSVCIYSYFMCELKVRDENKTITSHLFVTKIKFLFKKCLQLLGKFLCSAKSWRVKKQM